MEDGNSMGETPRDLTKPRINPYKNTWKRLQNTVYWCNLKLAQQKGLHFDHTRSHAVVLYRETCSNIMDNRISGVPLSAVEHKNTPRGQEVDREV